MGACGGRPDVPSQTEGGRASYVKNLHGGRENAEY